MSSNFDWDKYESTPSSSKKFDWDKYEGSSAQEEESPDSPARAAARSAYQLLGGAISAAPLNILANISAMAGQGEALAELPELQDRLEDLKSKFPMLDFEETIDADKYLEAVQMAGETAPTWQNIEKLIEATTGTPLTPKTSGQRALRTAGEAASFAPKGLIPKTTAAIGVPFLSSQFQDLGLSEGISDFLAHGLALVRLPDAKGKVPAKGKPPEGAPKVKPGEGKPPPSGPAPGEGKPPPEKYPKVEILREEDRFPSGLTKPKAVEAKKPEIGIVTGRKQELALEKLNNEASQLTKEKFHESFPTAKKMEEGFDFNSSFKKGFNELESQAQKANPEIDTRNFTKFLREEQKKYHGLRDTEAKKITGWVKHFRNNPKNGLYDLYRQYRSINRELKKVYDQAKLGHYPDQYVNFLERANQELAQSFRNTLPEDSLWMNRFDSLNKVFKNVKDAEKIRNILRPVLGGEATSANLKKLITDPKIQKNLKLRMGEKRANEVIQIAKDLREATEAIKNLSSREIKELNEIYPLPLLLLGGKIPGLGYVIKKGVDIGRRIYGSSLLKPKTIKTYDKALKAASKGDIAAYKVATDELQKSQGLMGPKEPKLLEYKPSPHKEPKPPESKLKSEISEPKKQPSKITTTESERNLLL